MLCLVLCLLAGCSSKAPDIKTKDVDCTAKYPASKAVLIELNGKRVNASDDIKYSNKTVSIDKEGSYWISGESESVMLDIDAKGEVDLYLDNVTMTVPNNAVIHSGKETDLHIIAVPETKNILQDIEVHKNENSDSVIMAESNLVIEGSGTIEIAGNYKNGIRSAEVCNVYDTDLKVLSQENGIQSKKLSFENGEYTFKCNENCISTTDGELSLISGKFTLSAGNDAVHSEGSLICKKPDIVVEKSKEGLEGVSIDIFDGTYKINSTDDGINSSEAEKNKKKESNVVQGQILDTPTTPDYETWTPEDGQFHGDINKGCYIHIHGGKLQIVAYGDGIDSNDNIIIDDGDLLVYGGPAGTDASLDFATTAAINGGTAVFYGIKGMVTPFTDGKCNSALFLLPETLKKETKVTIKNSQNKKIKSFELADDTNSILLGNVDTGLCTISTESKDYQYTVQEGHKIYTTK